MVVVGGDFLGIWCCEVGDFQNLGDFWYEFVVGQFVGDQLVLVFWQFVEMFDLVDFMVVWVDQGDVDVWGGNWKGVYWDDVVDDIVVGCCQGEVIKGVVVEGEIWCCYLFFFLLGKLLFM